MTLRLSGAAALVVLGAECAHAHASEQGFVLLLPTGLYIAGGVATVALTVLLLLVLPAGAMARLFRPRCYSWRVPDWLSVVTTCLSAACICGLIWVGLVGASDPLKNPLPLAVWTLWWIGLVSLQGALGDIWRYLNPLTGPVRLIAKAAGRRAPLRYPARMGAWPGAALFLGFAAFLLADPAPSDPRRLAVLAGLYYWVNLGLVLAFGPRWLVSGEVVTLLMRTYARVGLSGRHACKGAVGLTGWRIIARPANTTGGAILALCLLGSGSFDGLNETFRWLALIGVNPLEFPGRTAVMRETVLGLLAFNAGLVAVFAGALWLGERLAGGAVPFGVAFRMLALSILPIALGYHVGHYLPSFLVDVQYAWAAASDPLGRGDDLLGLGTFYVTTGFFNTTATVRVIWLSQAGAVVVGHVLAILLAHGLSLRLHADPRRAALAQAPLAVFMVLYTFFGLWLLASPRGF